MDLASISDKTVSVNNTKARAGVLYHADYKARIASILNSFKNDQIYTHVV